jgi:hypothetical protein
VGCIHFLAHTLWDCVTLGALRGLVSWFNPRIDRKRKCHKNVFLGFNAVQEMSISASMSATC